MFLNSNKVNMYPSSFRGDTNKDANNNSLIYDIESKLATEKNLVGYYNRIPSNNSYVVSWSKDTKILECVIAGYYFRLDLNDAADISSWTELWLSVKTEELNVALELNRTTIDTQILTGFDDNKILDISDKFKGVELTENENTAANVSSLHALTRTSTTNDWKIVELSDIRFKTSHVGIVDKNDTAAKYLSDVLFYSNSKDDNNIDDTNRLTLHVDDGSIISRYTIKSADKPASVTTILPNEIIFYNREIPTNYAKIWQDTEVNNDFKFNIGESNKSFANAYIDNLTSDTISAKSEDTGLTIRNVVSLECVEDADIGAADNRFTNLYVENVNASGKMTISNIVSNSTPSSIGAPDNYFVNGYITNVYSTTITSSELHAIPGGSDIGTDSVSFTNGYINNIYASTIDVATLNNVDTIKSRDSSTSAININGVAQIIPKNISSDTDISVVSALGNANKRFSYGFIDNLTTKNLTLDSEFQRLRSTTRLETGTYELYLAKIRSTIIEYYSFSLLEVMSTSAESNQVSYAHANVAIETPLDSGVTPVYFYSFRLACESNLNSLKVFKFVDEDLGKNISLDDDAQVTIPGAKIAAKYQVFYRKIF